MKTVRVRIAVAVDPEGRWNACGWNRDDGSVAPDKDKMEAAREMVDEGEARYWLEADLPIPTESTVEARVVADE